MIINMKKTILTLAAILIASLSFAQGGGFNYKALITENGNALANQSVTIKFTVLENGTTSVYQETHTATTDANGIVAVNIGEGTTVSGNFTNIEWDSNPYFLKVEIDTDNGYQNFGTTEFKAVPYAKYAEKAGNAFSGDFSDLSNVPAGLSDGDDDTHLTEAQVDAYVANNGFLSLDPADATTLSIQNNSTSSTVKGIDISMNSNGNTKKGININFQGNTHSSSLSSGIYFENVMVSSQNQFGIYNRFAGSTTSTSNSVTGLFNFFPSTGGYTGMITGIKNYISLDNDGKQYGTYNYMDNSGNGKHYGIKNYLAGNGTGEKYGTYNKIESTAGGTHFAVYGEAEKSGSYAGYFIGDIYTTQKLKAPHSGDADMKPYIYGYVTNNGNLTTSRSSEGFSVTKNSTGVYTITFDTPMPNASTYIVIATSIANSNPEVITTSDYNDNSFKVYSWNLSGNHRSTDFQFVVYKK